MRELIQVKSPIHANIARRVRKVLGKKEQKPPRNSIARENSFRQLGCLKNQLQNV